MNKINAQTTITGPAGNELGQNVRGAHKQFPTGVTVITAVDGGKPYGLTVNAFTSISYEPPMILICVNESAQSYPVIFEAEHIGVNIIASDQKDIASAFAKSGGDKFVDVAWKPGITGSPLLDGIASSFELEVKYKIPAYTHTIFIGRVVAANSDPAKAPLVYKGGAFFDGAQLVNIDSVKSVADSPELDSTLVVDSTMGTGDEQLNRSVLNRMLALRGPEEGGPEGGDIYGKGYLRHTGSKSYDLETFRRGLSEMYRGFPDMRRTVKDVIIQGDRAAYRWEATGTHKGIYMGVRPTHRSVEVSGIVQCRFANGRVVEEWATWDKSALLHQLGIMPLDRA